MALLALPLLAPAQARRKGPAATATKAAAKQPVDYVNVFTGTSNSRWALFPGPTVPFGMVKLSPDNQGQVWTAGYEYTVNSISGFSHLHAFGLSGLSVMPATGHLENLNQTRTYPGAVDGPFGTMWTRRLPLALREAHRARRARLLRRGADRRLHQSRADIYHPHRLATLYFS
ncbi:MAG: hypothetical protein WKG07_31900 [Hymenobacter sp.]